jgi:hypothetical protein
MFCSITKPKKKKIAKNGFLKPPSKSLPAPPISSPEPELFVIHDSPRTASIASKNLKVSVPKVELRNYYDLENIENKTPNRQNAAPKGQAATTVTPPRLRSSSFHNTGTSKLNF